MPNYKYNATYSETGQNTMGSSLPAHIIANEKGIVRGIAIITNKQPNVFLNIDGELRWRDQNGFFTKLFRKTGKLSVNELSNYGFTVPQRISESNHIIEYLNEEIPLDGGKAKKNQSKKNRSKKNRNSRRR